MYTKTIKIKKLDNTKWYQNGEQLELPITAGESINFYDCLAVSTNSQYLHTYATVIPPLGIPPIEMCTHVHQTAKARMFVAAFLITAKTKNNPHIPCPSNKSINCVIFIQRHNTTQEGVSRLFLSRV